MLQSTTMLWIYMIYCYLHMHKFDDLIIITKYRNKFEQYELKIKIRKWRKILQIFLFYKMCMSLFKIQNWLFVGALKIQKIFQINNVFKKEKKYENRLQTEFDVYTCITLLIWAQRKTHKKMIKRFYIFISELLFHSENIENNFLKCFYIG